MTKRHQIGIISTVIIVLIFFVLRSNIMTPNQPQKITQKSDLSKLKNKITAKKKALGPNYKPRTRHLNADGTAKYTNRLFLETSPYLNQHAHNPVDWYPWGEEAFEKAKALNRPILLSIGYATCHWCHVMEEESFENEQIAQFINENYIAIKIDREERPDIDAIYMAAVQAISGRGGWPMTVWLTPDKKPFYAGTYYPPFDGDRGIQVGFLTLLKKLNQAYYTQNAQVTQSGDQLTQVIQKMLLPQKGSERPEKKIIAQAIRQAKAGFDPIHGGMKGAPKFPSSLPYRLLLRVASRTHDQQALEMGVMSLKKMAKGGIYDHIGGGFHRYATDEAWLIPHFEKMLYDNALLAVIYLEAYQLTSDPFFKEIANDILTYVKQEMQSPEGGFYCATDADSMTPDGHLEEGYFFTWTPKEIEACLDPQAAKIIKTYFNVTQSGNFEGRTCLNITQKHSAIANEYALTEQEIKKILKTSRKKLYQHRQTRKAPIRDEKIITSINGLMISAFAKGSFILNDQSYLTSAKQAAQFILDHMIKKNHLKRSYKDGATKYNAYLEDYACLIAGLLDIYEADFDPIWLEQAIMLDAIVQTQYEDTKTGGFFRTSHDHETLIAREKPYYDGAQPSGNSVMLLNLCRLYSLTGKKAYSGRLNQALNAFSGPLNKNPLGVSEMLLALDYQTDSPKEIVIVTPPNQKQKAAPFLNQIRTKFSPNKIIMLVEEGPVQKTLQSISSIIKNKTAINKKVTAYYCQQGRCELPITNPEKLLK